METNTNNPTEAPATEQAPAVKKRRVRRSTFGERITVSYRFPEELHARMVDFCVDNATPLNTWLVGLVEEQLLLEGYIKPSKAKHKKIS